MKATRKEELAIIECYRRLFKNSTPSADFDLLVKNAEINEMGEKVIPFLDYSIDGDLMEDIIKQIIKEFKIKKYRQSAFRFAILLGCSPKTKTK